MIQPTSSNEASRFAQKLNLFDATMIVMSGIIGTGIFINPYIVAGLGIVVNTFIADTTNAVIGAVIIAVGVPVYFLWKRVA